MAKSLGLGQRTYASYERDERDPDALVLKQIAAQGWNVNWLLTGEGAERLDELSPGLSQDLSAEHLNVALELADETLTGLWLPRNRYAELVALIYDALTQGLPYAEILEFSRPAAKKMAGKEEDDNGGIDGMEGARSSGSG